MTQPIGFSIARGDRRGFPETLPDRLCLVHTRGIDPARQPIPWRRRRTITWGGIDRRSRTLLLERLWAVGECARPDCTAANRLASNSLLESFGVWDARAEDVRESVVARRRRGRHRRPNASLPAPPHVLRDAMTRLVGLARDAAGLTEALAVISQVEPPVTGARAGST